MEAFFPYIGLLVAIILIGMIVLYLYTYRRSWPVFRPLPGYEAIQAYLGRAVEAGTRIHVALGEGEIAGSGAEAEFAGLSALAKVTQAASISDRPPVVTSGDGSTALLSQDVMYSAYKSMRAEERFDPGLGRIAGLGRMGYAAGAVVVAQEENVSATLLIGKMGAEAAIVADAASQRGLVVAAVTEPVGQAAVFATADYPMVGEELFAAGSYLKVHPTHAASLQAQDLLRWLIIIFILMGAFLSTIFGVWG